MRAKTKVIQEPLGMNPKDYPDWSFDGSSTGQAEGNNSDCILKCGVFTILIKHKLCCGFCDTWQCASPASDKMCLFAFVNRSLHP